MAMSNLEPRPARLHPSELLPVCTVLSLADHEASPMLIAHWNQPYTVPEAVAGFKRAAATHGWEYVCLLYLAVDIRR